MGTLHHILFSRVLGVMVFCAFLVLTPRAWVESTFSSDGTQAEQVPINVLDGPTDCLWCPPNDAVGECDDADTEAAPARPWLNPDDSAKPLQLLPCTRKLASSPHS